MMPSLGIITIISTITTLVAGQSYFPPTPEDLTIIESEIFPGAKITYKQVGLLTPYPNYISHPTILLIIILTI